MSGAPGALPAAELFALSPLDGRYRQLVAPLRACFSEAALIQARVAVEVAYLEALLGALGETLSPAEQAWLAALPGQFGEAEAAAVKAIERETNHDVKAVELYLRQRLEAHPTLRARVGWVHLGLTSEDVNNLAWALLTRRALLEVIQPALRDLVASLRELACTTAALPMLARTHGQPATPTTLGKEFGVFLGRLVRAARALAAVPATAKLAGATGTFGAVAVAYPAVDWPAFSDAFVRSLGLTPVPVVTQIEPHDGLAAWFDAAKRLASVLLDLDQDLWRYVSDGWLVQRAVAGETGSSAMPHKVNPIDFENSEGNLGLAIALFEHGARKLPVSRLQRDLSDSTVQRAMGVAWGHLLLGVRMTQRGLSKLAPAPEALAAALQAHPEVLAEAYQVALRAEGQAEAYEALKDLTRGSRITLADLHEFLVRSGASPALQERLRALTPDTFVGEAPRLAALAIAEAEAWLAETAVGA
ncbi:MAG: adenylosuccinate lyase [Candidatus Sericytochromatia bacterium]|nr:adenylosuccinate lyase [Candidatus Sericytochromatia bacterium]